MKPQLKPSTLQWLKKMLAPRPSATPAHPSERQRALDLIAAIDAGGIPLNPARVNDIGRSLGLEVSRQAPMDETIARIRAVVSESRVE